MANVVVEVEENDGNLAKHLLKRKNETLCDENVPRRDHIKHAGSKRVNDSEEEIVSDDRVLRMCNPDSTDSGLLQSCMSSSTDEHLESQSSTMKPSSAEGESLQFSSLSKVLLSLEENLNIKYEVKCDSQNNCCCIYFQDKQMEKFFNFFPEFVCVDILCETVELELNLCLLISEDSNAHCEIIGGCLIKVDNVDNFSWMCETFKKYNVCSKNIKIVISDKHWALQEAIHNSFPFSLAIISYFHSLRALKRDLCSFNLGSTTYDVNEAIQIFERMIFANDENEYTELLQKMQLVSVPLFEFFQENWHPKKELWALCQKFSSLTHLNAISNFLFLIRKKIRPVVIVQTSVENILKGVFAILSQFRKEKYVRVAPVFQTLQVSQSSKSYLYRKYTKFLTYYASDLVVQQLHFALGIKNIEKIANGMYKINASSNTISTCSCPFYTLMSLPCSHIFALRKFLSLPLFVESLCAPRWTSNYYQSTYLALQGIYVSEVENYQSQTVINDLKQKFQKYFEVSGQLLPLLVDCSQDLSQQRMSLFQNLLISWKNGLEVSINVVENQNLSLSNHMALEDLSTDRWKEIYGISLQDILDSDNDFSSVSLCSDISNDEI